jgi:polyisoprenyl-teichoic acid--peptidoglycan teichoic acid transferase
MSSPAKKKNRKTPWKKLFGGAWYVLVCLLALALGTGARWVGGSPVLMAYLGQKISGQTVEDVFQGRDSLTILVLGCDEDRAYRGPVTRAYARSDSMLVTRIDFKNKRAGVVSIPRDLEVELPGYRPQKINAYHSMGGPDLAKQAAEHVVGIPIERVIVLNYEAFQKMVDAAGGVEVFVEKRMKYDDKAGQLHVDLKPGRQKLDGYEAMGFVRFRHDALSDFARQKRQKEFILAFKNAVKGNPASFPYVVNEAENVLNGGLTSPEVAALADFMQGIPSESIRMGMVPVFDGRGTNLVLDSANLRDVLVENYLIEAPLTAQAGDRLP